MNIGNTGRLGGGETRQGALAEPLQAGSVHERGRREPSLSKRSVLPSENAAWWSGHAVRPFSQSIGSAQSSAHTLTDWVGVIRQAWARSPGNVLALARLVSQARAALRHGEWSKLWCSPGLPISKKEADRLVLIGEALGAADETTCSHLPCAMRTLYYLARLGWATVKRLIEQGSIHPRMTIEGAKALLAEFRPGLAQKTRRSTVAQWLARVVASVEQKAGSWSAQERKLAQAGLLRLAEQLGLEGAGRSMRPIGPNGCCLPVGHVAASPEQTTSCPLPTVELDLNPQ